MALALNVFQTVTAVVSTSPAEIYTAPVGYSGIILLAQAANIGSDTQTVSFSHKRSSITTEIVKDLPIPAKDSTNLLFGKLILESGDSIQISSDSASNVKFIASILETLN